MKVFQVLAGGSWGGGCVVVLDYLKEMVRRGDEVWVLCLDDEVARHFADAGCKIVRSRFWFHPINPFDIVPFFEIFRLCRREKFDLVATHTSKGGVLGRLAARAAGIAHIVHHAHGFAFRETQPRWIQRCYIALERIAARACDLIISVSEDHRQAGLRERIAGPEKIVTVQNGIDVAAFHRARKTKSNEIVIGAASRLAPKKGLGDLIAAFPAIHAAYSEARLVIAGDGPARADLEEQARRTGLGAHIEFTGFRRDIPDLLASFDIAVQPSISEGLSISVLEAMAAAKPLVVCDIEGNRELIHHNINGLLVPPSDPAALGDAIIALIADPARAQALAARAYADCAAHFSRERMARQILESYDGVIRAVSEGAPECYQQS